MELADWPAEDLSRAMEAVADSERRIVAWDRNKHSRPDRRVPRPSNRSGGQDFKVMRNDEKVRESAMTLADGKRARGAEKRTRFRGSGNGPADA